MVGCLRHRCLFEKYTAHCDRTEESNENCRNTFRPGVIERRPPVKRLIIILLILLSVTALGCRAAKNSAPVDACALALATHSGNSAIDQEIVRLQEAARHSTDRSRALEQLGWAYVRKSRISFDPGFYKLAEQCATCISSQNPESSEALLLRGYVLSNLHRFQEAEVIARKLAETRAAPFDYALLGDALMEQGRLGEAIDAYQKMVDLKPGPQAYTRIAHIRWLKGDLDGAIEMMRKAAGALGTRDAESAAWAYSRLALYELQAGSLQNAERACEAALYLQSDYAPALLARARISLAQNRAEQAAQLMQRAVEVNPLPEYRWLLAEALRTTGRIEQARAVEDEITEAGTVDDPRTLALFLSTRGERLDAALSLAEKETSVRGDVFTLDALAWALSATGKPTEALDLIRRALAEGTEDARLFYHAGSILARTGQTQEARLMLRKAETIKQMLLPSERDGLSVELARL
jgi:tetratricopeptide (TPR) repeat protein